MIFCVKCKCLLKPEKNGVYIELKMGGAGEPETPYKIFQADLKKCHRCGMEVVADFGYAPAYEHFQEGFEKARENIINSCGLYEEQINEPDEPDHQPKPILAILKGIAACLINGKFAKVHAVSRISQTAYKELFFGWLATQEVNFHNGGFVEVVMKNGEVFILSQPDKIKFINPGKEED